MIKTTTKYKKEDIDFNITTDEIKEMRDRIEIGWTTMLDSNKIFFPRSKSWLYYKLEQPGICNIFIVRLMLEYIGIDAYCESLNQIRIDNELKKKQREERKNARK